MPFVPAVRGIPATEAGRIPGLEAAISYWTEGLRSAAEWMEEVNERWGSAGFVMRRGDETLGFAVYGPREYLPRVERYPVECLGEEATLLAYVGGEERVRRHLLVRVLRDLKGRKVREVAAVGSDHGARWHVSTRFLLRNGWQPVRRGWRGGRPYTLLRTDLGNAVEVGELARGLIGRVKLPTLKSPEPAPGAFVRGEPTPKPLRTAGSRS